MGIRHRKERDKEERRRKILDAANNLFREQGFRATSLRNIAEAIEYSPASIYTYFKDKNAILFALQFDASRLLREHLLPTAKIEDPWKRLIEIGRQYIDFGLKHSDLYDLLFIMRSPMEHIEAEPCWLLGLENHKFLLQTVVDCQAAGYFKNHDAETIAYTFWCHAHGMVALFIRNRMKMYAEAEKRLELLKNSFNLLETMALNL